MLFYNVVIQCRGPIELEADAIVAPFAHEEIRFNARVIEGTRVLCRSLGTGEAGRDTLHPFGKAYAKALIRGALRVRAQVDPLFAARPELIELRA